MGNAQKDHQVDERMTAPKYAEVIETLLAALADFERRYPELADEIARLRTEAEREDWQPLKLAASLAGMQAETLRLWCKSGRARARRDRGRWLVDTTSLPRPRR